MPLSLEPIYGLTTKAIMHGATCVGYLQAPTPSEPTWDVWPDLGWRGAILSDPSQWCASFTNEADAIAFLGRFDSQERVAA